jgi:hypothetical protein
MVRARDKYRAGITTLLTMGGLEDHVPTTEREWVLFDTNQMLRDQGVGKELPWAKGAQHTAEDVIAALVAAGAAK